MASSERPNQLNIPVEEYTTYIQLLVPDKDGNYIRVWFDESLLDLEETLKDGSMGVKNETINIVEDGYDRLIPKQLLVEEVERLEKVYAKEQRDYERKRKITPKRENKTEPGPSSRVPNHLTAAYPGVYFHTKSEVL